MPIHKVEELRRSGLDAYKARDYDVAELKFFGVIAEDWRSAAAGFAVDYLKKILQETGVVRDAKKQYDQLVETGEIRAEHYSPEHVGFFQNMRLPGKLEEHLSGLLKLGGMVAARTSLIGVILESSGLNDPGAYFVDKAQRLASEVQKKAVSLDRHFVRDRPLHFNFSRVLDKSEYPILEPNQLESISFNKRRSVANPEVDSFVQTDAQNISSITSLRVAFLDTFDSNVVKGGIIPANANRKSGSSPVYFVGLESQSNPARRMSYGGAYSLISRQKSRVGLDDYIAVSHVPGLWVSWWNARDLEVRIRYDYAFTKRGVARSDLSKVSHGPSLQVARDWGGRGRLAFSLSQVVNAGETDGRNGSEYAAKLDFISRNEKKGFEPHIGYSYLRNVSLSGVFNSVGNEFRAGSALLIGRRAVVDILTTFRWTKFSAIPQSDTLKLMEAKGVFPVGDSSFSFLTNVLYEIQTSTSAVSEYSRWAIGGGVTHTFDW